MYIPASIGRLKWPGGSFSPRGNPVLWSTSKTRGNPLESYMWSGKGKDKVRNRMLSARLIIGMQYSEPRPSGRGVSVKEHDPKKVVAFIKEMRIKQTGDPSMSIITQHGIYKHEDESKGIIEETSIQVIIFDTRYPPTSQRKFYSEMLKIAEGVIIKFDQESVIMELQNSGIPFELGKVIRPMKRRRS